MHSTAHHPAGDPTIGRRATRYGTLVTGTALAAAVAVTLAGTLSAGDDATRQVVEVERPPDVISQQAATDTTITRTLGDRSSLGHVRSGAPAATDTMITRSKGG